MHTRALSRRVLPLVGGLLLLLLAVPRAAAQRPGAEAQALMVPPPPGEDTQPPTVTITPASNTDYLVASRAFTIAWCDNGYLQGSTRSVKLNGVGVSTNWLSGSKAGCEQYATSSATVNLAPGNNLLTASIRDFENNTGSASARYSYHTASATYTVLVTPDGGTTTQPQNGTRSVSFSVQNQGNIDETYNLAVSCSGQVTPCSVPTSVRVAAGVSRSVSVSYTAGPGGTTGSIVLTASASHRTTVTDSGSVTAINGWLSHLTVNGDFSQNADRHDGLCDAGCFAATYAYSTVPYVSLDQPRSVTLAYDGDAVAVRPFILVDASIGAGAAPVSYLTMEAAIGGAAVTFLNGDQVLHFQRGANPMRLAGQFDASTYETGVYPLTITVTAVYSDHVETKTVHTRLIVVNERKSYVARGWTFAGLQRIDFQTDGSALVLDGTGSATFFGCYGSSDCFVGSSTASESQVDRSTLSASGTGSTRVYTRTYPDGTVVRFSSAGLMTSITDRVGTATRYGYDSTLRLTEIYDPIRQQPHCTYCVGPSTYTVITYGAYGISSIAEPSPGGIPGGGRSTSFSVSPGDSTLRTITEPDGSGIALGYDGERRLETETLPGSRTTRYVYDPVTWKLASTQLPAIPAVDANGVLAQRTPTVGYRPWQAVGVPTTQTTSSAPAPAVRADTIRAVVTDAGGHTTRYTVDRWGQPLVITDPVGNVTSITREYQYPVRIDSPTGAVDTLDWNVFTGQLLMSQRIGIPATYYSYGAFGMVTKTWGAGQPTRDIYLSANGLVDSVQVNGTTVSRIYYDDLGRDTMAVDAMEHTTKSFYDDELGNRDSTWATGDRFTTVGFDAYGRDSVITSRDEPSRRILYDVMNRVTAAYDGVNASPTQVLYDPFGAYVETTDPKGLVYRTNFNAIGWVESEKRPGENNHRAFEYDVEGQVARFVDRRTHTVRFRYDALHRLTWKQGADGLTDTYGYSANGLIRHGSNAVSMDSVFTRANGWTDSVVTRMSGKRFSRRYTPDASFRLSQQSIATDASISFVTRGYSYDAAGMLSHVTLNGKSTTFRRNDDFQRDTTSWPGGVIRSEVYTAVHQLSKSTFSSPLGRLTRSYGYDPSDRIVQVQRPVGTETEVRDYTYDGLGRLKTVEFGTGETLVCTGDPTEPLTKEAYGERCTWQGTVTREDVYSYDEVDNLSRQTDLVSGAEKVATIPVGTNELTGWGSISYSYDREGNREQRVNGTQTTQYTWSSDGRLVRVTKGSEQVDYAYNAFGQLVLKKVNGVAVSFFLWDGDHLLAELDNSANGRVAEYAYLPGIDNPFAVATGATAAISYIAEDALGNVVGVFDTTGSVRQGLVYDEWGVAQSVTGTLGDANRLRWKGLLWEPGITQLYYVRNRWYDPEARRFISEDPIGLAGGINLYTFAGSDPANFSDPFGLDAMADPCIDQPEKCVVLGPVVSTAPAGDNVHLWVVPSSFGTRGGDGFRAGMGGVPESAFGTGGGAAWAAHDPNGPKVTADKSLAKCAILALNAGVAVSTDVAVLSGVGIGVAVALKAGAGAGRVALAALSRVATEQLSARYLHGSQRVTMRQLGGSARNMTFGTTVFIGSAYAQGTATSSMDVLKDFAKGFIPIKGSWDALKAAAAACW